MTPVRARWGLALVVALVAFAAQTGIAPLPGPPGIRLDLALVAIVAFALHYGPLDGAILGLVAGFVIDIYGGRLIGMGALAKLVAGAMGGVVGQKVFREHLLVPVAAVLVSSFAGNLVYLALARAFGVTWPILPGIQRVIVPAALYDAVAGILLYPLLARLYRLGDRLDERRRARAIDGS